MRKKLTAILLVLSFVFSLAACDGDNNTETTGTTEEYVLPTEIVEADVSLPYTSAEGFDPYSSKSELNRAVIPIMYESLYLSTENCNGKPLLASKGTVEGTKITVKIKKGVKFSDGSTLTSSHIKSSFEKAKDSLYYSGTLSNISCVNIINEYTVVFEMYDKSIFTLNTLNFPIVKYENSKPLGSGKYKLQYLDDIPYLSVNTSHRDFKTQWNKQIALYDMAGKNGPVYPFKANEISVYKNALSGEEYVNLSSQTVSENMNNLVYVGVNSKWAGSVTSVDWVRHAINIGIDRTLISASSFLGRTSAAVTPFKNQLSDLKTEDLPSSSGELQKAIGILERNGYSEVNSDGVRTNGNNTLRLSILVCSENSYKVSVAQSVKESLENMGFGVTIKEVKTAKKFKNALKEGHFDLYIGETSLSYDYGLEEFFTSKGDLNYGIDEEFYEEYRLFAKGETGLTEFVERFETEVPFVPLFYRKAIISVNPNISGVDENNIYSSICDWKITE